MLERGCSPEPAHEGTLIPDFQPSQLKILISVANKLLNLLCFCKVWQTDQDESLLGFLSQGKWTQLSFPYSEGFWPFHHFPCFYTTPTHICNHAELIDLPTLSYFFPRMSAFVRPVTKRISFQNKGLMLPIIPTPTEMSLFHKTLLYLA